MADGQGFKEVCEPRFRSGPDRPLRMPAREHAPLPADAPQPRLIKASAWEGDGSGERGETQGRLMPDRVRNLYGVEASTGQAEAQILRAMRIVQPAARDEPGMQKPGQPEGGHLTAAA